MHRTAIVIKLSRLSPDSSSVSWWLARVLVRDRKAPEHPGLWLVLRNLIWPLIGRDKPATLLSFSVRDMTLWWSELSRPSHINSPVLSAAAASAQTPSCRQWVMSWWAWHRAVAVQGPVSGNEGNHMNYDPALTMSSWPLTLPSLDQLTAAHCLLKFLSLVCQGKCRECRDLPGRVQWRNQIHRNIMRVINESLSLKGSLIHASHSMPLSWYWFV